MSIYCNSLQVFSNNARFLKKATRRDTNQPRVEAKGMVMQNDIMLLEKYAANESRKSTSLLYSCHSDQASVRLFSMSLLKTRVLVL